MTVQLQTVEDMCLEGLKDLIAALDGVATAERNRTAPWNPGQLNAVSVINGALDPVEPRMTGIDAYQLEAKVEITATADDDGALTATLDDLKGRIIRAVAADETLGGPAFQTLFAGQGAPALDRERGHKPQAVLEIRFSVQFMTAEGDPFTPAG